MDWSKIIFTLLVQLKKFQFPYWLFLESQSVSCLDCNDTGSKQSEHKPPSFKFETTGIFCDEPIKIILLHSIFKDTLMRDACYSGIISQ